MRLFLSTRTGATISWYVNFMLNRMAMKQIFHEQFYGSELEVSMTDLAKMHQGSNKSVQEYLGRFIETRGRCTVNIP